MIKKRLYVWGIRQRVQASENVATYTLQNLLRAKGRELQRTTELEVPVSPL